ncbi:MAG: hypothetical protein HXY50_13315 [Ignavibacteriaceae bacterium]|nr:hypothetical protein [Ignavibacteriaceae bacterium]
MDTSQIRNNVHENAYEDAPETSVNYIRLKQQFFKKSKLRDFSYLEVLKEGSKFFTFDLPKEISEYFVRREDTPNLWLLEYPIIIHSEKYLDEKNKTKNQDENTVKRYYQRWVMAKESYQKKIFSSLAAKLLANTPDSKNFLDFIYFSIILLFDESIKNCNEAIWQLQKAKDFLNNSQLEESFKQELNYHIELYKAYAQIELGNFEAAGNHLSEALQLNSNGITAKFYLAYVSSITNQPDLGSQLVKNIVEYDIRRLKFACESNNNVLLNYFIQNTIFTNIFYYSEFAAYSHVLEESLRINIPPQFKIAEFLKNKLDSLKELELDSYYTKKITKSLEFFCKFIEEHKLDNSYTFRFISQIVLAHFATFVNDLKTCIHDKTYIPFENEMKRYDGYIDESTTIMNQLSKELVDFKEEIKKKLSQTIQQIDEYTKESIQEIEISLQNLEKQKRYNPVLTFRNSMSYNIFVSIIVFIIGGVAGYNNNSGFFDGEFNVLLAEVLVTGLKWAALTFIVGFFIALGLSVFVLVERSNQKQRLHRSAAVHSKEKEIAIEALKEEAESKQISITENFNQRIESHKRKIENLKREKEERRKFLEVQAEQICQPIFEKLDKLYLF